MFVIHRTRLANQNVFLEQSLSILGFSVLHDSGNCAMDLWPVLDWF